VSTTKSHRILEAAHRLLAEHGHASVTIEQIAREADVSKGLLHYYFENKEQLLAGVVRRNVEASLELARQLFAAATDAASLVEGFVEAYVAVLETDPSIYTTAFEAFVQGRRHEAVATELADLYRARRHVMTAGLVDAAARGLIPSPPDPEALATMMIALADGLALQALADPTTPRDQIRARASTLLRHILEVAL
jgi:AcrR family transcriptional regulator